MKRSGKVLIGFVSLLIAGRAALPLFIQEYVNRTLDRLPHYDGHIGDVDLALFRGAYEIEDIEIVKTDEAVPVPFFKAAELDLSIEWKQLLNRSLVGEIVFIGPQINFVAASPSAAAQTGADQNWTVVARRLFPININRLEIRNGSVHYRDREGRPPLDVYISSISAVAENLTNSEKVSNNLSARARGNGRFQNDSNVSFATTFNPYREKPTFDVDLELKGLFLPKLNDFFRHYAGIDVEGGTLDLYIEAAADNGRLDGYAKPFVENLNVVDIKKEKLSFGEAIKEGAAELAGNIFENRKQGTTATRIPFSNTLENPEVGAWAAVGSSFRHILVQALKQNLENSVDLTKKPGKKRS